MLTYFLYDKYLKGGLSGIVKQAKQSFEQFTSEEPVDINEMVIVKRFLADKTEVKVLKNKVKEVSNLLNEPMLSEKQEDKILKLTEDILEADLKDYDFSWLEKMVDSQLEKTYNKRYELKERGIE